MVSSDGGEMDDSGTMTFYSRTRTAGGRGCVVVWHRRRPSTVGWRCCSASTSKSSISVFVVEMRACQPNLSTGVAERVVSLRRKCEGLQSRKQAAVAIALRRRNDAVNGRGGAEAVQPACSLCSAFHGDRQDLLWSRFAARSGVIHRALCGAAGFSSPTPRGGLCSDLSGARGESLRRWIMLRFRRGWLVFDGV